MALAAQVQQAEAAEPVAGCLVEFRKDRERTGFALLQEPDGKRNWHALDVRGVRHSIRPQQIVYVLPGGGYTAEDMQAIHLSAAESAADASLMEAAWEVVSESEAALSVPEMAELLFSEAAPAACCAAHRLLSGDRSFFKQVGRAPPLFQARPQREVAMLRARAAAEERAAQERAERLKALSAAIELPHEQKPSLADWLAGPCGPTVQALQDFALAEHDPGHPPPPPPEVLEVARSLAGGAATPLAAAQLLKMLGAWAPHEHLAPLRAGLTESFPADVMAQAEGLASEADSDAAARLDLTHLPAWAVDSADTTEVDDAVSWEAAGPGGRPRLWVHVADPTRWLARGSPMAEEAARRTTSLYLPTGSVPMFPRTVAEQLFSLAPGRPSCALSVWFELAPDGALAACGAAPSTVSTQRLTYTELDARLEAAGEGGGGSDADLSALSQAAQLRQAWRVSQGAVQLAMPECRLHVGRPDSPAPDISISVRGSGEETPAEALVAELMIAANEAVGWLGEQAGVALPFRGQAAAVLPESSELAALPEGPCRKYAVRCRMTRSVTTTGAPLRHASLGLARYVQATSPIRRYADLLAHWQLKAHLRGEPPPWGADGLAGEVEALQARGRTCVQVEREVSRYWQTQFFARLLAGDPEATHDALLLGWVREESGFARGLLAEYGLEVELRVNRPAAAGERLAVRCVRADVATAELRFEEAAAAADGGEAPAFTSDEDGSGDEGEAAGESDGDAPE